MATYGKGTVGFSYGLTNLAALGSEVASEQAQLGDFSGATATIAAPKAFVSPSVLRRLGPAAHTAEAVLSAMQAEALATIAYERGDLATARRIAHTAIAALQVQGLIRQRVLSELSSTEGRADYALGDFAAAEQAERTALMAVKALSATAGLPLRAQRAEAQIAIWLSMALAREGKREEAAETIAPAVTTYRALEKRNHGDQWLPLELAEALYAQSLTDGQHRAALLHEASGLVDHLIPAIARLRDTRQWRTRIEAAQRTDHVATVP
jgi:tetratricopeptide (TPR) repeat protein